MTDDKISMYDGPVDWSAAVPQKLRPLSNMKLTLEPRLIEYAAEQRDAWSRGERSSCIDPYCAKIGGGTGTGGFGEYIVGRYWESLGYQWIHHDFDVFAGVKREYQPAETVLQEILGDRLGKFRNLAKGLESFHQSGHSSLVEHPDLMIFDQRNKELRFAECKRLDTRDSLNSRQALGLFLIAAVLQCPVDVFVVAEQGTCTDPLDPIVFACTDSGLTSASS